MRGWRVLFTSLLIAGLFCQTYVFARDPNITAGSSGSELPSPRVRGPYLAGQYPDAFGYHGVGGDTRLLFIVVPSPAPNRSEGVYVSQRLTGEPLGQVVAPPGGWLTPLSIQIEEFETLDRGTQGTFLLLDAGGPPEQLGTLTPFVHRFRYSYSPDSGFRSEWIETHALPFGQPPLPGASPSGIVYTEALLRLPDGTVAINDTILGGIWVADSSLEGWRPALLDPELAGGHCDDIHGTGREQGGGTRPYTMRTPMNFCPGIHSMTYAAITDEVCTLRTAPPGGIYCIKRSTLLDPLLPAATKGVFKRTVVAPQVGLSDLTDGIAYDRYDPDSQWLYWQRAIADEAGGGFNTLRRVHLLTGEIQTVASSNEFYDFANNITALPPLSPTRFTTIFTSMGQEENNPEVNVLLNGIPAFVSPTLLTLVEVER